MIGLTERQKECLAFIKKTIAKNGVPPSFQEINDALGLASKSGVTRLIDALAERGFVRRIYNRARSLEVIDPKAKQNPLSFLHPDVRAVVEHTASISSTRPETLMADVIANWAANAIRQSEVELST